MSRVELHDLSELWSESVGEPFTIFENDDPRIQAGSYVIQPGERVPPEGTTSHDGPELSVILSGEVVLGLPDTDEELVSGPGTFAVIPAGVEHYSENRTDESVELVYAVAGDL